MTLLALECSSLRRSVAVGRAGVVLAEAAVEQGRETPLFRLIEDVLRTAAVAREEIDTLVVGLGPGSYTGIRAALAVAQGWQLARGDGDALRTLGIASPQACAWRAHARGQNGQVRVLIDAQRGEFYVAEYDLDSPALVERSPIRLTTRAALEGLAKDGGAWIGPDLAAAGMPGEIVLPDAAALAQLAWSRRDFRAADQLEPIYLRATNFVKAPPPRVIPG